MNLTLVSHGLSAALFAGLAILLVRSSGPMRASRTLLLVACLVTAGWSLFQVFGASWGWAYLWPAAVIEGVRNAAWLSFTASLLPSSATWATSRWLKIGAIALPSLTIVAALSPAVTGVENIGSLRRIIFSGFLVTVVFGFLLIEQVFRNRPAESRWSIKFIALGVGAIFAYDLYMYSEAALLNALSWELWAGRGFAYALAVPLLLVGVRRYRAMGTEVFISRQAVFFSATLLASGIYLLLMALAGYYLRAVGGDWGRSLQGVFFLGALIILGAMLLSGSLRAWLKVFLAKHFFANKYDYREQWMALTSAIGDDAAGRTIAERSIRALASMVHSPGGALWMLGDGGGQAEVDSETYELGGVWREWNCTNLIEPDPLTDLMSRRQWVVHSGDLATDPDKYDHVTPPDWFIAMGTRCLAIPLFHRSRMIGFVALRDPKIGPVLDYEDIDILKSAGRQVAEVLRQEQASRMLAESRQFDAYNKLTAFLMHDLKNLVAQQSLVVKNAEKYKRDPEFVDDAIETIAGSVRRMEHVIEQLKRGTPLGVPRRVRLVPAVAEACKRQSQFSPKPTLEIDGAKALLVRTDQDQLISVIAHVIRNAQEASDPDTGQVTVRASSKEGHGLVEVIDDGEGMDEDFLRSRLFRPFDSTKGTKGMGIGAYQVKQFIEGAGGHLEVYSRLGDGTSFQLWLPMAGEDSLESDHE